MNKGYTFSWSEEIFVVRAVVYTTTINYALKALLDELIDCAFYEQQLQRANQEIYKIEKL